jgi:methyl-galactoside transport system substrate-binding protein
MKILRRLLIMIMMSVIITSVLAVCSGKVTADISQPVDKKPIKVGVLLYRFDDAYISLVRQSLEEIQKQSEGKVEFTFYDGKNDQSVQNKTLNQLLQSKDIDLLLLNLVDTRSTREAINKIKEKNIPVVLFNREPVDIDAISSYNKSYFVGTDAKEAGILQGKILIDAWNSNKATMDKNKDNVMQYVMLMGERDNLEAIARTKYSILEINDAGIRTQELATKIGNWNEDIAKSIAETLFLQYGNKIEAIISNNDSMAIGAIKVLQKYGYNKGDKAKTIPVVGVDAIPEAQNLIKQGFMTGSVLQDANAMAEALYKVGMNLVYNRKPLDGTEYKFDETGVAIRIPYSEYKKS